MRNKTDQIVDIINQNKLDILFLTETWLKPGDTDVIHMRSATPPDFTFHHVARDSDCRGGGVAVICRKDLHFKHCDPIIDAKSFEHISGLIPFNGTCIRTIVIYRIPPSPINKIKKADFIKEFTSLLEIACCYPGKILISGDFNIHWDDESCTEKQELEQLLGQFCLYQSVDRPTHLANHIIDFVISRQDDKLVKQTRVSDMITDHALVKTYLAVKKPTTVHKSRKIRKIQSIDIDKFKQDMAAKLSLTAITDSPDSLASSLSGCFESVINHHAPVVTKSIPQRSLVPWFNNDVRTAIIERRNKERKWRKNPSELTRLNFQTARNRTAHTIHVAKVNYYNESIEKSEGDQKKIFSIIDTLLHRKVDMQLPLGPINETVNSFSSFFHQKIVKIRNKIKESIKPCSTPTMHEEATGTSTGCQLDSFTPVQNEDVTKLINASKSVSCDLDKIPTSLLKKVLPAAIDYITKLINLSLSTGTVPTEYKQALITPLIKKPSLCPEVMTNYRPISNLPFLSKILEKVVMKQLTKYMVDNNLHEKYQSAYKRAHSTETALLKIHTDVLLNLANKRGVVLVLLDLSAAFDTIDHDILLLRLKSLLGIDGTVLSWFNSYLKGRSNAVSINQNVSASSETTFGVPQGSVLGPTLFTIYTMPLSSIIESHGLKYHFYADDTQIYLGFQAQQQSSYENCIHKVEECIMSIKQWMSSNMLKLNDEKTEVMYITSPFYQKRLNFHPISVDQTMVSNSSSARNIGVIFDSSLLMKDHIDYICKTSHFQLRNIRLIRKYLNQDAAATLIHSLISTRIDYCNSLLANLPTSTLRPLQGVQNSAARIVTFTSKYDHITPVLEELHWLPVKQRIMFKILLLVFRCINNSAPSYLNDLLSVKRSTYSTRSSRHLSLSYSTPSNNFAARAFSIYGPMLFNALPPSIRDMNCATTTNVKKSLKTFLFTAAYKSSASTPSLFI